MRDGEKSMRYWEAGNSGCAGMLSVETSMLQESMNYACRKKMEILRCRRRADSGIVWNYVAEGGLRLER